jgi:hypothetical protein
MYVPVAWASLQNASTVSHTQGLTKHVGNHSAKKIGDFRENQQCYDQVLAFSRNILGSNRRILGQPNFEEIF